MALPGRWKGYRHGNFLADRKLPGGFNKRAVGADVADRRDKDAVRGFAGRRRMGSISKPLPAALPSICAIDMRIFGRMSGHTGKPPVVQRKIERAD